MTAGARVRGLDGLRGIAILLVVAYHFDPLHFRYAGTVGVTLFFVLSGFLITSLLIHERERTGRLDLKAFYMRRALRLYPALLVAVFGAVLLMAVLGDPRLNRGFTAAIASALLYVTDIAQAIRPQDFPVLGHTWSLSVEEQFYLIWPMLLIGALIWSRGDRRRLFTGVVAIAGLAVAWHIFGTFVFSFRRVYYGPDTVAFALLLGCALAAAPERRRPLPGWATWAALAMLAVLSLIPSLDFQGVDRTIQLWVALATGIVGILAVESSKQRAYLLAWLPLAYLGRCLSYSWYLWHVILRDLAIERFGDTRPVLAASMLAALGVALLSWKLVEEPILRRKKRYERGALEAPTDQARYRATLP